VFLRTPTDAIVKPTTHFSVLHRKIKELTQSFTSKFNKTLDFIAFVCHNLNTIKSALGTAPLTAQQPTLEQGAKG